MRHSQEHQAATAAYEVVLSYSLGEFDVGGCSGGQTISSALLCTGYRANPFLKARDPFKAGPLQQDLW